MKISFTWILAAIVVILILLVGAYALTNNNNAPATKATATPTTTATPSATPVASPSAIPSTVASATPAATTNPTPTATPSPSGSSGVRQTEFGYYITYPPFADYQINPNPNYAISNGSPAVTPSPSPSGQVVQFISSSGYAISRTYIDGSTMDMNTINYMKPWFVANITLTRTSTSGTLSPTISISETNIPSADFYINKQPTFEDGQSTATVQVIFDTRGGGDGTDSYAKLMISPSSAYTTGNNNPFYLDTFVDW